MASEQAAELGGHLARRIVSLLPAATETVYALGLGDQLVGRSHECDFPAEAARLPVCSRAQVDPRGTSAEIHAHVSAGAGRVAADALSIYEVDLDALRHLRPTHILTQTICDVCAVSEASVVAAIAETGIDAQIVPTAVRTLADYWADFVRVGSLLAATEDAIQLVARLQDRVAAIEEKTLPLVERPRVLSIEWMDPLMAAGNWMPELVRIAGGQSVLGEAGEASPWVEWEQIVAAQPDVLLISPCGFGLEQTLRELDVLRQRPGWADLPAVGAGQVFAVDGNAYLHRPGPRLVDSVEMLAQIIQPESFPAHHGGEGWVRIG